MPIEVIVIEPTGSETQVVAKAGGKRDHLRVPRARHRAAGRDHPRRCPIRALVHLFDKETGQRVN